MKDNWKELFDSMKEDDILRNLPEELPEMEDELAAKRIENRVLEELQVDIRMQKKQNKKRYIIAAACCVLMIGVFGHKPILAAFERWFHDLPGVGVYINEEDKKVYEVQIDDPVQEQDGIRVELKDFYCEGNILHGTFAFTGEGLEVMKFLDEGDNMGISDILKERFRITYYYEDTERIMFAPRSGYMREDDGRITSHTRKCEELIPVKNGVFEYEIAINGFDRRFHLKLVEPKTAGSPEELGYSQTLNDTTVTARAAIVGDMIEVEYFIIPSEEVKLARENRNRYFIVDVPYQYDMEERIYVENEKGERLQYEEWRNLQNGTKFWYKGTEADFPLTFHQPTLTGTNEENYLLELTLPETGETITENLPKLEFQYGTVEILSITREIGEYDNRDTINPEISPAAVVDIVYRVTPKDGQRQMYRIELSGEEEYGEIYGSTGFDTGDDYFVEGRRFYLTDLEKKTMKVKFHMPSFWILGEYDIVIEKPMEE